MMSLCKISRPTHSLVMLPLMGCLLATDLLVDIKPGLKKQSLSRLKKRHEKTDIKKGAYGPFQIGFLR